MGKNLGNIPRQVKMSEEQEQTFTNGVNKGRKLERNRIIALLETLHRREPSGPHDPELCAACRGILLIKGETA